MTDKTFKDYLKEDQIDDKKMDQLEELEKSAYRLMAQIGELEDLDRAEGASGAYDLTDQIVTMDKHMQGMIEVIRRAFKIVPTNEPVTGESVNEAEKRWKQTSMSPQEAIAKYGKENVKVKKGALRNGDDMVEVFVESMNEAGGYYTQPVYDMIEQHGIEKVMHELLTALDGDVIQDALSRMNTENESKDLDYLKKLAGI